MTGDCLLVKHQDEHKRLIKREPQDKLILSSRICLRGARLASSIYFVFLAWRLASFILYAVHSADNFFAENDPSYRCANSTLFPHSQELELAWQTSSVINSVVCIAILPQMSGFQGYWATFRRLAKFSRFWSLLFQLLVTIVYATIIPSMEHSSLSDVSVATQVGFILVPIFTTSAVCLWNSVPAPRKSSQIKAAYNLTLAMLFFENVYLCLLVTAQIAFRITGVQDLKAQSPPFQAIVIVVHAGEASFYYALSKFFWNKWFDDKRNLLKADHI